MTEYSAEHHEADRVMMGRTSPICLDIRLASFQACRAQRMLLRQGPGLDARR